LANKIHMLSADSGQVVSYICSLQTGFYCEPERHGQPALLDVVQNKLYFADRLVSRLPHYAIDMQP